MSRKCSTTFPGGNQVDGLPPARHFNCVLEFSSPELWRVGIPLPVLFRRNAREICESSVDASEAHLDTPLFGDFGDFGHLVVLCPGASELRPWRSQEVKGSPELQNGGLRALEEAWDDVRPAVNRQPGYRRENS